MAIRNHNFFLPLLGIALFLVTIVKGQENGSRTPLIDFIQELEHNFDVKFSYADNDLKNIWISVPKASTLDATLNDIEYQTQLQIQKLNDRYYAVTKTKTVNICAQVLDNFEQNTVSGATVEILGTAKATVTDENGNFYLTNVPRDAYVQIKFMGFKTLFVAVEALISRDSCATLLLAQFYQQLEEVVVYEFLTKGLIQQTDGSLQMNSEKFGILPGLIEPDVLQTVQALPGIKSVDETVSDINIRGGTNDQNLILWDGIKMYQSGHFFGLISAFNPYLTDQVTLIKNGTSAQYGGGVSGIIDMRTQDKIAEKYFGGAGLNLIGGDAYAQVPLNDKLAIQFSARRSLTDLIATPTYDRFFKRVFENSDVTQENNFYFYDFTGKLLYDFNEKHKLRFSFININNLLDFTERHMEDNRVTQSALDQTNLSFGGSLRSHWNEKLSTFLNAYYTQYNLDARNISSNSRQILFQNNQVQETALQLNTNYIINDQLQWLNGYAFSETGITNKTDVTQPPYQSNERDVIQKNALFSEMSYRSDTQKWFARGGLRCTLLENPNAFQKFLVEPRLSLSYSITRALKLQLLGEFKSQAINQVIDLEQDFLGIEKRRWLVSDEDVLPVTQSKHGSLGIHFDEENFYVGLEGFYKDVEGISTVTQGFQNQNQFNGEIGKYTVKGFEFLINAKTSSYSIWASYTYNNNDYSFPDIVPPNFPNNLDIRHTATLAGTYTLERFKFGIGLNYRSGKPYTEPDWTDPIDTTFYPYRINYKEPNSNRLPEYLRADASAVYQFELGRRMKASFGVSVLNLASRSNILDTFYQLDENDEIEKIENVSLGLTPNASLRLRF
ncbi:TonB-dependent receptor [Pareuzebyella sediminis]|uniref:TonB-dependent receptor n=1 Tax=Pareuzebyella sediminis TaxID=2607998 RepID=UPI0011EFFFF1|nr:TonB-dependent receptor [Pareuzebyella sediminis]